MSAIGSVMVIVYRPFSPRFPPLWRASGEGEASKISLLPGRLGHTGELTAVSHFPDAHAAQTELAVDRLRPATPLAAGVRAHRELWLGGSLEDQRLFGHAQFSLNGK